MVDPNCVEKYQDGDVVQAIVIRSEARLTGVSFLTEPRNSFQIALMTRDQNSPVKQHIHNSVKREIHDTQEFLLVRQGRMTVQLFDTNSKPNHLINLYRGDCILLSRGAHGIQFDNTCELLEVKQGPYVFDEDKKYIEN